MYYNQFNNNFINNLNNPEAGIKKTSLIKERVNLITTHMFKQYLEYQQANQNTNELFNRILNEMEVVTAQLKESFSSRGVAATNISCQIDSDKSVGILNIIWHTMSFTTRGNTRPQALQRKDNPPLFSGRIIALNGDFQDTSIDMQDKEYPEILSCEIASLYVPSDPTQDAIIKIKHLGDNEFLINQIDAPREFLLKVIEVICGGGFYHEEFNYNPEV